MIGIIEGCMLKGYNVYVDHIAADIDWQAYQFALSIIHWPINASHPCKRSQYPKNLSIKVSPHLILSVTSRHRILCSMAQGIKVSDIFRNEDFSYCNIQQDVCTNFDIMTKTKNGMSYVPISLPTSSTVVLIATTVTVSNWCTVDTVLWFCISCADIRKIRIKRLITIDNIKYAMQPACGSLNRSIFQKEKP